MIEGCVQMKRHLEEEDQLLAGLYYQIGKLHADNTAQQIDAFSETMETVDYPDALDTWFDQLRIDNEKQARAKSRRRWINNFSRRAAMFAILVITGLALTTLTVEAFRIRVFNFVLEVKEKYTQIDMREQNNSPEGSVEMPLDQSYYPERLLNGYTLKDQHTFGEMKILYFSNSEGKTIEVGRSPSSASFQVNTENAVTKSIKVNDAEGILVEREGVRTLLWIEEASALYIIGELTETEIISMAESFDWKADK